MSARKKGALEKVQDCPKTKEEIEKEIAESIREFYYQAFDAETVEQIAKLGQNSFISACEYANRKCIKRDDLLTLKPHKLTGNGSGGVAFNEIYDKNKVEVLAEVYCSLCFLYDKVPSVYGFAQLSGIERATLQNWVQEVRAASRFDTPKNAILKLKDARAQSLSNLAISGGKPALGAIAHLNNELWKDVPAERPAEHKPLAAAALPVFDIAGEIEDKGARSSVPGVADALPVFKP